MDTNDTVLVKQTWLDKITPKGWENKAEFWILVLLIIIMIIFVVIYRHARMVKIFGA